MADMTVYREDGHGARTAVTLRITDWVWAGLERKVEVVRVEQLSAPPPVPHQRITSPEELARMIAPRPR